MVVRENVEDEVAAGCMEGDLKLVVTSILPLIFTKLPLCHSYLQNCHSATQNYKIATLGPLMLAHSLCWRGNDMEIMWKWCGDSLQL